MAEPQASIDPNLNNRTQAGVGSTLANNLMALPVAKQVSLVIAIAASIALIIGILSWSQDKPYTLLFGSLDAADINEVVQTLDQESINYKIDQSSGGDRKSVV